MKMNTEPSKTIAERLDRLERLICRLILEQPAGAKMQNLGKHFPEQDALNKRFSETTEERDYAFQSVLDIASADIAAIKQEQSTLDSKRQAVVD